MITTNGTTPRLKELPKCECVKSSSQVLKQLAKKVLKKDRHGAAVDRGRAATVLVTARRWGEERA